MRNSDILELYREHASNYHKLLAQYFITRVVALANFNHYAPHLMEKKYINSGMVLAKANNRHKKPPGDGFTILLIALIILAFTIVPGVGLELTQRERRWILNLSENKKKLVSYLSCS